MSDTKARPTTADRATEIRDYVERLIAAVGEHHECELKRAWRRDTPFHSAEVVKDIQATASLPSAVTGHWGRLIFGSFSLAVVAQLRLARDDRVDAGDSA